MLLGQFHDQLNNIVYVTKELVALWLRMGRRVSYPTYSGAGVAFLLLFAVRNTLAIMPLKNA